MGFLRCSPVDPFRKKASHHFLRRAVLRHAPTVAVPVPVKRVDKVADDYIALFLESGNRGVKAFFPFCLLPAPAVGIACRSPKLLREDRRAGINQVKKLLVLILCESVVIA